MITVNNIKEEYKGFQSKIDFVANSEDLMEYIDIQVDDINEDLQEVGDEIDKSEFKKIISNLKSKILRTEDYEYFQLDYELMEEQYQLGRDYIEYFQLIQDRVDDSNYKELLRLSDFTLKHYLNNFNYIDDERDILSLYYKGINAMNKQEDTRIPFDTFFLEKIKEFHREKGVEKQKKL